MKCAFCYGEVVGAASKRYCSERCKVRAKARRLAQDGARLENRRKHRRDSAALARGGRKHEGSPEWRSLPRAGKLDHLSDAEKKRHKQRLSVEKKRVRKARMHGVQSAAIPWAQVQAKFDYWGNLCWMCGAGGVLSQDHVKPVSKGGSHLLSNIRPACISCNSSKKDSWNGPERTNALHR